MGGNGWGGARRGAGRPRDSVAMLKLRGTFRRDRHAEREEEERRKDGGAPPNVQDKKRGVIRCPQS